MEHIVMDWRAFCFKIPFMYCEYRKYKFKKIGEA